LFKGTVSRDLKNKFYTGEQLIYGFKTNFSFVVYLLLGAGGPG